MAQADWRRYYVPVFANGECGTFTYLSRTNLLRVCGNLCERFGHNYRLVGILAIKSKKQPSIQQALFSARFPDRLEPGIYP